MWVTEVLPQVHSSQATWGEWGERLTFDDGLHITLHRVDVVQCDQQLSRVQRGQGRVPFTCGGGEWEEEGDTMAPK